MFFVVLILVLGTDLDKVLLQLGIIPDKWSQNGTCSSRHCYQIFFLLPVKGEVRLIVDVFVE